MMANTATLTPIRPADDPIFTHNVSQFSPPQSSPDILHLTQAPMAQQTEQKASRGKGRHSIGAQLDAEDVMHKQSSKQKRKEQPSIFEDDGTLSTNSSEQRHKKRLRQKFEAPSKFVDQVEAQSPQEPDVSTKSARHESGATELPSLPENKRKINKLKFYAVLVGHTPGIYDSKKKKNRQIEGFVDAKCEKFDTYEEAEACLTQYQSIQANSHVAEDKETQEKADKERDFDDAPATGLIRPNPLSDSRQSQESTWGSKFYAVVRGRIPGIYPTWAECEAQVKGFPGAIHRKFDTKGLADAFIKRNQPPRASLDVVEDKEACTMKSKPEGNNVDGLRETEAVGFIYGSNGRGQSPKTNLQGGLEMKRRRNAQSTQARRMLLEPSFPSHELISINAEDGYTDSEHRDLASIVSNWKKQLKPNSSTNLEPSPEELKSFKRGKLLKYTLSIQVRLKETLEELKAEKIKVNNFEKSVTYQTRDGAPIVDLTTPPKRKQIEPLQLEQISPRRTEITQETTNTSHSPSRSRSPPPYSITVDSPSSEEWSLMDPRPAFSAPRATPTYNEPPLCEEQSKLVDTIVAGHNVFYTGSAGCGKSTVLRAFVKRLKDEGKRVDIVAPTGRAALDVSGSTTWTYAGWTPNSMKETLATLEKRALGKLVWKRLTETHVLVIDEVSMIENHHFERLNLILKAARDSKKPFGGVQLVVTGDFCQLPPVKPFQHCIQCGKDLRARGPKYTCPDETCPDSSVKASVKFYGPYYDDDKWTFRSAAWKECKFEHRNLTDIHRQSDKVFIAILEKCRLGKPLSQEDIRLLLDHPSETTNAVKLFPTLAEVKRVNYIEFAKLQTPILTFKCFDQFDWNKEHESLKNKHWRAQDGSLEALKDHKFETRIELKKGMLVILLVNLSLQLGLVNGSQGEIIDFVEHTPECLPEQVGEEAEYKKAQINKFIENVSEKVWPVVRFTNGEIRTITPHCWFQEIGDPKPYSRLSRTQIPLIAAWAMSIHKSQGMTLDRVIVDLGRSFEKGQMYVALSRARTLEGLKVVSLNPKHCEGGGNEQVKEFLYEKFGIE